MKCHWPSSHHSSINSSLRVVVTQYYRLGFRRVSPGIPFTPPSHIPSFVHQSTIPNRAFSCFKWIFSDPDCVKFFPQNPQ